LRATRQMMPAERTRAPRLSREKGCRPLSSTQTNRRYPRVQPAQHNLIRIGIGIEKTWHWGVRVCLAKFQPQFASVFLSMAIRIIFSAVPVRISKFLAQPAKSAEPSETAFNHPRFRKDSPVENSVRSVPIRRPSGHSGIPWLVLEEKVFDFDRHFFGRQVLTDIRDGRMV
jgi:hypothetical protein